MMDADEVNSKQDFLLFLAELQRDLLTNPEDWENHTLPAFLDAMSRWVADMEGYYRNTGQEIPRQVSWRVFANIIQAASIYE
ncbi:hypothetical protein EJV47_10885 [Hymenobacter gummosus]|uniref:DUF7660 domain-containing protein n=1 Tax=Hymenobacter gummosus TaxID=1776032 RepID=A0A3S0H9R4_9BACT|nr:hypothetical protein [Hymenobacter gummosus]RTQ50133.1 hypothetical protein EJV47_10885 [Hymenobacter gummosus]